MATTKSLDSKIRVRIPLTLKRRLGKIADKKMQDLSDVVREALLEHADRHDAKAAVN